jgi:hypothetical protein
MTQRSRLRSLIKDQRLLIESVLEDGVDAFIGIALDPQGSLTGLLHPFGTVVVAKAYDAQRASEALLGMGP